VRHREANGSLAIASLYTRSRFTSSRLCRLIDRPPYNDLRCTGTVLGFYRGFGKKTSKPTNVQPTRGHLSSYGLTASSLTDVLPPQANERTLPWRPWVVLEANDLDR